jgi:hypothetical protein
VQRLKDLRSRSQRVYQKFVPLKIVLYSSLRKFKSKRIRWEQIVVWGGLLMSEWVATALKKAESEDKVGDERIVPRIVSRKQLDFIQNGRQ